MSRAAGVVLVAVWLAGCAPFTVAKGTVRYPELGFEAALPPGWAPLTYLPRGLSQLPYTTLAGDALFLTREGLELQGIGIGRSAAARAPDGASPAVASISLSQAKAIEVDTLRATPGRLDFELLEESSVTVAGRPAFRLVYTWRTSKGLRYKGVKQGLLDRQWIYWLVYEATARHYFDQDLPIYDSVGASFRITE
jgi:hypothetical protein